MEKIQSAALQYMVLPEMRQYWTEATARRRQDWELPALVASAIDPNFRTNPISDRVVAAIGCCQISIILVDDILDDDPKGAYRQIGAGKAANMALAFQSVAFKLVAGLDAPAERARRLSHALSAMSLRTAVGQHLDVSETAWSEAGYWQVVDDKSTPFYEWVMGIGALMHGNDEFVATFRAIGKIVGQMIQIRDDLVDIMAETPAPDWAHGGNLLLIYARENEDRAAVRTFETAVAGVLSGEAGALESAQEYLIGDGAVNYCAELLKAKAEDARGILRMSAVTNHQPIQGLLDKLVNQVVAMLGTEEGG